MTHLSEKDQDYLRNEFGKMHGNAQIVYFTSKNDCQYCETTQELLQELTDLSDHIALTVYNFDENNEMTERYNIDKIPAVVVEGEKDFGIRYFGIPSGYEFSSLVSILIEIANKSTSLSMDTKKALAALSNPLHLQVFVTPSCPYCPSAVHMAHQMAFESDKVRSDMIEATEFPDLSRKYSVGAVPKIVINDVVDFEGALPEPLYLEKVLKAAKE